MDRKRFIKEKARYAFIRERTREIREQPRHRAAVPGLDYAEDIQGRDASEPGEREAAVDRTEDMAISSLGYTEKALKYAKRKYRENVSHRETHFESRGASAASAEDIPEMCFTVRHISMVETAYPGAKELLREKAVEEYKIVTGERSVQLITKILYPETAKHFGVKPHAVERAIRTLIELCWRYGDKQVMVGLAGYELEYRPSNAEFLDMISAYIKTTG